MSSQQHDILTERQWEVAYLVANGLTDGEIAEVLCIARGTASVHVHEILGRLGARRRTDIATWYASLPENQRESKNI